MRVAPPALALSAAIFAAAACGSRTAPSGSPSDAGADTPPDSPPDAAEEPDAVDSGRCEAGALCDDGRYCDVGTCDPVQGCVFTSRSCDDGAACTRDTCDESKRACEHAPDDALCPSDQLCSAIRGCASFVYSIAADGNLYEVDVPSGQVVDVGTPSASTANIALEQDGTLVLTDSYILYTLDRGDATTTAIASIMPLFQYNALGSQPNGPLLAGTAESPFVYDVDPMTAAATPLTGVPAGYQSSGDITSGSGTARYMTVTSSTAQTTDSLFRTDVDSIVGDTGFPCVWGLATLGSTVYGLTCHGLLISIDTTSGAGTMLAQSQPAFLGAAGR